MDNYIVFLLIIIVAFGVYYYCELMLKQEREINKKEIKNAKNTKNTKNTKNKKKKKKVTFADDYYESDQNDVPSIDEISGNSDEITIGSELSIQSGSTNSSHGLFSDINSMQSSLVDSISNLSM